MKTAILLPTWVGDACMATPTIRAIREGIRDITELCLVGRYAPLSVLEGLPEADSYLVYKPQSKDDQTPSRRGLVAELKRRAFDTIVLLPNSLSAGLIGYLSGARRRIGYAKDGRSWLLTDRIPLVKDGVDCRALSTVDYYMKIAEHLGCKVDDPTMKLAVTDEDREDARQMFQQFEFDWSQPTIVINAAAAMSSTKQWPSGHASRAAKALAMKHGLQVIIHSGPADRRKSNAIEYAADHPLVRSMGRMDQLPMGLSKAVLEQASVVVSSDSGPRHIAVALNRPVVALFGPTSSDRYKTYNRPEQVLNLNMKCSPCGKDICPLVHNNCMHGLTYPMVVAAVLKQLDQSQDRRTAA
jgi:heptosyltransferase II